MVIALVITTIQMFERTKTLDSVRSIDFKLISNAVRDIDLNTDSGKRAALDIFKSVSLDNGFVLFPLALYSGTTCMESVSNYDYRSICGKISGIDYNEITKSIQYKYNLKFIPVAKDKLLVYKHPTEGFYILGLAGKYTMANNQLSEFITYITQDWTKNYLNINGLKVVIDKSWHILLIMFILQLITIFIVWNIKYKNKQGFEKLVSQNKQLYYDLSELQEQKKNEEDRVTSLERQLADLKKEDELNSGNSKIIKDLENELLKHMEELEKSNKKEDELKQQLDQLQTNINKKTDTLSIKDSHEKLKEAQEQKNELNKLWIRSTKWLNRVKIEQQVAPSRENIAFTNSLGFIAFENYVIHKFTDDRDQEQKSLNDIINDAFRDGFITREKKSLLHDLRIARNQWFHHGKYPTPHLIKELVNLLTESKTEPSL